MIGSGGVMPAMTTQHKVFAQPAGGETSQAGEGQQPAITIEMTPTEVNGTYRWSVDNNINPTITLVANVNNTITVNNPTDDKHELVITMAVAGGAGGEEEVATTGDIEPGDQGELSITPNPFANDSLRYHCEYHPQTMLGDIRISNATNTTQSNQSAPLSPLSQQQQQQKIPLNQSVVSENFRANGTIDSIIYTTNGNWKANGIWTLTVSEGELTSFDTKMTWNNGTAHHTHEFQNFVTGDSSDNISIDSNGTATIEGDMDVATNGVVSWPSVPAEITIEGGKIITISLDHEDTENHFGGHDQAIHGTVTSLKPCSVKPGPNMQVPTDTC